MNRISHKARLFGSLLVLFLCLVGFMQQAAAQCVPAANPDLNNDGIVSLADLYIVTNNFGVPGADETADTNCDGNVDTTDVLFVRSAMGQTFPVGPVVVDIPIDSNPTEFLTDTETTVRFQARILPDLDADPSSAFLYEVDDHLNPQGPALCNLLDNGDLANGDDIAGDSVFSCFVTFLEEASTEIKVAVHILSTGAPASSSLAKLQVVEPLTDQEVQIVLMTQSEAQDIWEIKKTELGDTFGARVAAAEAIALLLGVADAGVSDDEFTIWIKYESGVNGGLMLNPPGTKGDAPVPIGVRASMAPDMPMEFVGPPTSFSSTINQSPEQLPQEQTVSLFALNAATDPTPVGNTSVVVWDPYSDQFPTEGAAYNNIFANSQCPSFSVTHVPGNQATVDSVRAFSSYGTVVMSTHGAVDGDGRVVFLTREEATFFSILGHTIDLLLGRIGILGDVFVIRPSFISNLPGGFQDAIVLNSSCQSSGNNTMANAFLGKGVKTYYGFTEVVSGSYAEQAGTQLLTNLVDTLDTTGDAYAAVTPKVDPNRTPAATFTQHGDTNVAYTGKFLNGSFETGDLTSWVPVGDGRVIATLGGFTPTDGTFMGIISTGLGFTTSSGSVEQSFCLPETATKLEFDWNFNSEEFVEWCGAQHPFDDTIEVELVTDSGTSTLMRETVDTLCGSVSPTNLSFDQSGPGCIPSDGVGSGTGGNDCTVWSTGWSRKSIDISGIANGNDGKGVTLRFKNFDEGDSIFDSAVLLDDIEIVTP